MGTRYKLPRTFLIVMLCFATFGCARVSVELIQDGSLLRAKIYNNSGTTLDVSGPNNIGVPPSIGSMQWKIEQGGEELHLCAFVDGSFENRKISDGSDLLVTIDKKFIEKIYCVQPGSYSVQVSYVGSKGNYKSSVIQLSR